MKRTALVLLLLSLASGPASAELVLPSGFTAEVYVTGSGFGSSPSSAFEGIPAASTMAFESVVNMNALRRRCPFLRSP